MADNTELLIRIRADTQQALREIRDVREGIAGTGHAGDRAARGIRKVGDESKSTAQALGEIKQQIIGLFAVEQIKQFAESLVDAQVELQRIQFTMQAATGSSKEAASELQFVARVTEELGTDFQTAASGYARLAAAAKSANIPLSEQHDLFVALQRAGSVLHFSQQDLQSSMLALEQMFSKGTVQAQELRLQLGQAIPGLVENFNHALGISGNQLEKLLQSGQLATREVLPALIQAINQVAPDNALTESVNASNASLNRMRNAIFRAKNELASGGFIDTISTGAETVADLGAAFDATSSEADNSQGSVSGIRVTILELAKAAAYARAGIKGLGSEIAGAAAIGSQYQDYFSAKNLIPGYGAYKVVKGAITGGDAVKSNLDSVNDSLNDNYKQLQGTISKIDDLLKEGPPDHSKKLPSTSDYAQRLKKVRDELNGVLNGGADGGESKGGESSGGSQSKAVSQINTIIESLTKAASTYGKTSEQVDLYRLKMLGANKADREAAEVLSGTIAWQKAQASAAKEQAAEAQKSARAQAQFVEQIKNQIDPARQYRQELQRLDQAYADGQLSAGEYADATKQIKGKIEDVKNSAHGASNEMSQYAVQAARNIQNTLADFIFNPFDKGLSGMVSGFAEALQHMAANAAAAQIGNKLFGNGFGNSGELGGLVGKGVSLLGGLFGGGGGAAATEASAIASIFHDGGDVHGGHPVRRSVPLAAFVGAPRFHSGIDSVGLKPDEVPAILQTGERVLSRGQVAAQKAQGQSGGGTHVSFGNFVFQDSGLDEDQARQASDGMRRRMQQVAKEEIAKAKRPRGQLSGAGA